MEDSLGRCMKHGYDLIEEVLILVVMEDSLGLHPAAAAIILGGTS